MIKITRIIRSVISLLPYVGSGLENLIFGSLDDKKQERMERKLKATDEIFGIERDEKGNVTNNPLDCGEY